MASYNKLRGLNDLVRDHAMKHNKSADPSGLITLFLCGDVMTGRGIDQILPHPGDATFHEFFIQNTRD